MFFIEQSSEQSAVRPFDLRDRGLLLADGVFDTNLHVLRELTDVNPMLEKYFMYWCCHRATPVQYPLIGSKLGMSSSTPIGFPVF